MQVRMPAATFRKLGRGDLSRLAELSVGLGAETAEDWSRRFDRDDVVIVGAEVKGALVGYAAGVISTSFGHAASTAWIDAFGVDLGQRGRGVGRRLATALLGHLRERGADHVCTLAPIHDRALGPFFRDLGFRDEPVVCLGRDL